MVDAHHHFWNYSTEDYGWISDEMARIRQDFLPDNLAATLAAAQVDGAISVQARSSIEETEWLLGMFEKALSQVPPSMRIQVSFSSVGSGSSCRL